MIVYRLSKSAHAGDLSGIGAEKCGARWNGKGVPMLYTSESRALCTTEIAVHTPLGNIPVDYKLISIEIPGEVKIATLKVIELPMDWRQLPYSHSTQRLGDRFVKEGRFLVLKVPSAVVEGEHNYLINPNHKDFKRIQIVSINSFTFDERLFVR